MAFSIWFERSRILRLVSVYVAPCDTVDGAVGAVQTEGKAGVHRGDGTDEAHPGPHPNFFWPKRTHFFHVSDTGPRRPPIERLAIAPAGLSPSLSSRCVSLLDKQRKPLLSRLSLSIPK
jgi:hypothetical protein